MYQKQYVTGIWVIFIFLSFLMLTGCEDHSSDTSKNPTDTKFNLGETVNGSVKVYLSQTANASKKLSAYGKHEKRVVDGVNFMVDMDANTKEYPRKSFLGDQSVLKALYELVEDNNLPRLTDACAEILKEVGQDEATLKAIADFINTKNGVDFQALTDVVHKALCFEKSYELFHALAVVIQKNPDLLKQLCYLLYQGLTNLPEDENTAATMKFLSATVAKLQQDMGQSIWIARLDKNDNPQVLTKDTTLFAPFVDQDGDGACDVDEKGNPVDAQGKVLDIPALGDKEFTDANGNVLVRRDEYKRAISPEGKLIFNYYDAKKSILAVLVYNLGKALEKDIHKDLYKFGAAALLPMKTYKDSIGEYQGYSNESDLIKALLEASNLLKQQQTRDLLTGFANMFDKQDPEVVKQAFIGLGQMVWQELRDNPKITDKEKLKDWLMAFGMNPPAQIMPLFMLMSQTEANGNNMAMLFIMWVSSNVDTLADALWPLIQCLRSVKNTYLTDQGLTERLFNNVIEWAGWALAHRVDSGTQKTIATIVIEKIVTLFSTDADSKVEILKQGITSTISSRWFALFMKCLPGILNCPVFQEALINFLKPNPDPKQDVFTAFVKMDIGILECRRSIATKVHLFKMIGKFFNPDLPIVINALNAIGKIASVDKEFVFIQILRSAFGSCYSYELSPLAIFGLAYIDILRVDNNPCNGDIKPEDIHSICMGLCDFLSNPDGVLKRIYRTLQKSPND